MDISKIFNKKHVIERISYVPMPGDGKLNSAIFIFCIGRDLAEETGCTRQEAYLAASSVWRKNQGNPLPDDIDIIVVEMEKMYVAARDVIYREQRRRILEAKQT